MITNANGKIAEIEIMIAIEIEAGVMVIEIAAVMMGTEVADLLLQKEAEVVRPFRGLIQVNLELTVKSKYSFNTFQYPYANPT